MEEESASSVGPTDVSSKPAGGRVVVNKRRQEGNPVLRYVRNVRYEWGDCAVDFECGPQCGVLYLALRYHKLHPDYIYTRLRSAAENKYRIKVLLALCNVDHKENLMRELNLLSLRMGWTLLCCYSVEEAAEYIENLKLQEGKSVGEVKKRKDEAPKTERQQMLESAVALLSSARSVTKTDAQNLLMTFGSLKRIASASEEELSLAPGLGPVRAKNLYYFLRTNFNI